MSDTDPPTDHSVDCYDRPQYWDLAFSEDTSSEADFVAAAAAKYCDFEVRTLLEPGCGGGRLVTELGRRGFEVQGWDLSENSVAFANSKLSEEGLPGTVLVRDMKTDIADPPVDSAYCLVSTFRHLLTEADAVQHLQNMAASVRPGGLYILGLHLLPPDADEEDEEDWSVTEGSVTVDIHLNVADCDRVKRLETLQFVMTVRDDGKVTDVFQSDYRMRLYNANQITDLFAKVPEFELLDVFDFWYDIQDPLTLSDEMGDTVFVLKRT